MIIGVNGGDLPERLRIPLLLLPCEEPKLPNVEGDPNMNGGDILWGPLGGTCVGGCRSMAKPRKSENARLIVSCIFLRYE